MAATYLRELQQNLIERFNWSEIEDLCLRLNVDHEISPGTEKSRWLRGLLYALGRDGPLNRFLNRQRPFGFNHQGTVPRF